MLPLLYGLGARDYVDHLGYVLERCPSCGTDGPFALYQTRRKITFLTVPTVSVREQQVLECRTCGTKFAVPADRRDEFVARLMGPEEIAARLREAPVPPGARREVSAAEPTHYRTLQVDPAADPEVIEAAFRRLALKYHPDRAADGDAAERMRQLLEAKAVLADPARRQAYDASLGIIRRAEPPRPRAASPAGPATNGTDRGANGHRPPPAPPAPRPEAMRPEEV